MTRPFQSAAVGAPVLDDADAAPLLGPDEVDMEEPVIERGARHFDAFRQHEGALELPRRDAAMEIDAILVVDLLAAHDELVVLDLHGEVAHREAGNRQGDAELVLARLLDIVGRVAVSRNLADAVERPLEMIEAEQ